MYLSEIEIMMQEHLDNLIKQYEYKKLPAEISSKQRLFYMENLPDFWKNNEYEEYEMKIKTRNGTVLATGVSDRGFVCGDYGIFIEIEDSQINHKALRIQEGQEYRFNEGYTVKYLWYTDRDDENIKMYHQVRGVTYADYKPNKWYVSPYEIVIKKMRKKKRKIKTTLRDHMPDRSLVIDYDLFSDTNSKDKER